MKKLFSITVLLPFIALGQNIDTIEHTADRLVIASTNIIDSTKDITTYNKKQVNIVCMAGALSWSHANTFEEHFINTTGQNFAIKCFISGKPTFYYGIGAQLTFIPHTDYLKQTSTTENIFIEMTRVFKVSSRVYLTGGLLAGVAICDNPNSYADASQNITSAILLYGFDMGIEYKFCKIMSARIEIGANAYIADLSASGDILWPSSIGVVYHAAYTKKKIKHISI